MADEAAGTPSVPTITVEIDGASRDIPLPAGLIPKADVDAKYVPKPYHNDQMARIRREADARKDWKAPDDLLNDPDFKTKAVQTWGLDPNAAGQQVVEQVKRKETEILEREVKPRDLKLGKLSETVSGLRLKDLRGQIAQASGGLKIEDKYLKPPTKGGKPLIVAMLEDQFAFDEEHQEWFAKGQGGFAYSTSGETPYMTVPEWIAGWVNGDGKDFVRSERQAGAESRPAGQGSGSRGGELVITRAEALDGPTYKRKKEQAAKAGQSIRIAPEAA